MRVDLWLSGDREGGRTVYINSRGKHRPERDDPIVLTANAGLSFVGSCLLGMGFTLTPEERDGLIARNRKNVERIFPYIGGEEVNTSPTQMFHRYVINFGDMSLEEAGRWPDLLAIVRENVKPERDKLRGTADGLRLKESWWLFGRTRPALYDALRPLPICMVNSQVSKHLIFAFQPTERVFAHTLYAYPLPHHTHFAILQSRIHEPWARLLSSTMEDRLRYAASDCFENFPFPHLDPRAPIPELETIGQRLYGARATMMIDRNIGLTKLYNTLKDPHQVDQEIQHLRLLHEQVDRAVLNAYGWNDIKVPPFTEMNETFNNEIIDRLFVLNRERKEIENAAG